MERSKSYSIHKVLWSIRIVSRCRRAASHSSYSPKFLPVTSRSHGNSIAHRTIADRNRNLKRKVEVKIQKRQICRIGARFFLLNRKLGDVSVTASRRLSRRLLPTHARVSYGSVITVVTSVIERDYFCAVFRVKARGLINFRNPASMGRFYSQACAMNKCQKT